MCGSIHTFLTCCSDSPIYFLKMVPPLTSIFSNLNFDATWFINTVFPQPEGPYNKNNWKKTDYMGLNLTVSVPYLAPKSLDISFQCQCHQKFAGAGGFRWKNHQFQCSWLPLLLILMWLWWRHGEICIEYTCCCKLFIKIVFDILYYYGMIGSPKKTKPTGLTPPPKKGEK